MAPDANEANASAQNEEAAQKEAADYWGYLIQEDKRGTELFDRLLKGIAEAISKAFEPSDSSDLTPTQIAAFYRAVGGNYDMLFVEMPPSSLSFIYCSLGVFHSLQPAPDDDGYSAPSIPALKKQGFVTWQTIQLLLGPEDHVPFLQNALKQFDVVDPKTGNLFPKLLPKESLPDKPDDAMEAWYEGVAARLKREGGGDSSEDEKGLHVRVNVDERGQQVSGESADERHAAASYFSDPLYRKVSHSRPSFVHFSKQTARPYYEDAANRARLTSSVRRMLNPFNKRRSVPRRYEDDSFSDDDGTPIAPVPPVAPRYISQKRPHPPRRESTLSSTDSDSGSDRPSRRRSPVLRRRRSHEPATSSREYFPPHYEVRPHVEARGPVFFPSMSPRTSYRPHNVRYTTAPPPHPDTMTSMANLASTYRNQDRWKAAEEPDVQVMETRKKVLRPELQDSVNQLGSVLESQEKYEAAEAMERREDITQNLQSTMLDQGKLPQLVIVGDQSAGKSSVLEQISRVPFPQTEMKRVTDKLLDIFLGDQELGQLYKVAINKRIDPETLAESLGRLLESFSSSLKGEAQDSNDLELADFVSSKSSFVASEVCRTLKSGFAHPQAHALDNGKDDTTSGLTSKNLLSAFVREEQSDPAVIHTELSIKAEEPEETDREETNKEAAESESRFSELVTQGHEFMKKSHAFKELRKNFRNLVMPPSQSKTETATRKLFGLFLGYVPSPSVNVERCFRNVLKSIFAIRSMETSIPPGHQRVKWTNRHGKKLYDDYIEREPGALQALQEFLNTSAYRTRPGPEGVRGRTSSVSHTSDNNLAWTHNHDSSNIGDYMCETTIGDNKNICFRKDVELGETRTLHLLSCMEKGRHSVELYQELITHITDDQQLFHMLRRSYHNHRGRFRPYWSLKTVHSIHFMKFAYGGRRYIDVRCHDDICEQGRPCDCIPPASLVPPKGTEYECHPVPSKLSPPVGQRLMMDFFTDPNGIASDTTLVLQQLPKKACGELRPQSFKLTEAWGIYYKEAWDWVKIWWVLAVGFFSPSLLFGILWGVLKKDIQGAFGVASWWMTGATILIGIVGTCSWTL